MAPEQGTSPQPDVMSPQGMSSLPALTSQQDSHEDQEPLEHPGFCCSEHCLERSAFVMVGAVMMLTSAAYWTNQAIVNRYTYLTTLLQLTKETYNNSL